MTTPTRPVTDAEVLQALQEAHSDPRSMEDLFATADDIRTRLENERGIKQSPPPEPATPAAIAWTQPAPGDFVTPLLDDEVRARFPQFAETLAAWRRYAACAVYAGPVAWRTQAGFTLKDHAPKAGPCNYQLVNIKNWTLKYDVPTDNSLVFWVPKLVTEGFNRTAGQMVRLRTELRAFHKLPVRHCTGFGSIALLFALILMHFKCTHERVPANFKYAVSDSFREDGYRLVAGRFSQDGLRCSHCDDRREAPSLSFFLLGEEPLGN